jgi:hypothetical protein
MFKQMVFAALATAAIGGLAVPASADNIGLNQWYTGAFTTPGTALFGPGFTTNTHGPVLPWPGFADAIAAPAGTTWTITLRGRGTLTVTDVEISGDQFQMFIDGNPAVPTGSPFGPFPQNPGQAGLAGGFTSAPCVGCSGGVSDINDALGNADYSSGTFWLHPGVNVISGTFLGVINNGDWNFIAESVPEPASWAMMIIGFGMVGGAMRRSSRTMPRVTA